MYHRRARRGLRRGRLRPDRRRPQAAGSAGSAAGQSGVEHAVFGIARIGDSERAAIKDPDRTSLQCLPDPFAVGVPDDAPGWDRAADQVSFARQVSFAEQGPQRVSISVPVRLFIRVATAVLVRESVPVAERPAAVPLAERVPVAVPERPVPVAVPELPVPVAVPECVPVPECVAVAGPLRLRERVPVCIGVAERVSVLTAGSGRTR